MPPAVIGSAFVAMGASTATGAAVAGFVSAVYVGAAVGAAVGAGTALMTGGDVLEGAVKGAVIGGITKGVIHGIGQMGAASSSVGVGEAGMTATQPAAQEATQIAGAGVADSAGNVAAQSSPIPQVASEAAAQPGFLDKTIGFIEDNPKTSEIIAGGVSGAAKAISEKRNRQAELEAQMERDRLLIESRKIHGLQGLNTGAAIPTISGFLERPKWKLEDLKM
jgi:hypothetical protein